MQNGFMNKIIGLVLVLVIGASLVGGLLIPTVQAVTATEATFKNEGAFYVEADPTEIYTIKYDKATKAGVVYINDVALNVGFSTGYTILAIDNAILRLQSGDDTMQYKGNGSYLTGIKMADLTITGGSITGTYTGGDDQTGSWPTTTYTELYIASPTEQNFVMTEYNTTTKMLGDSEIFAFGQTVVSNTMYLFKITGTITDGVTVACLDKTTGEPVEGAVISNVAINKTAVDGYLDLYDLTSITFTVTLADNSTADCTYSAYIVPAEVTAERAQHMDAAQIAIFGVIGLLGIVLLVTVAANAVRSKY